MGPGDGEKRDIFSRRIPQNRGIFGGMRGEIAVSYAEEIPPERAGTGAVLEGENVGKWVQKRTHSELLQALFGVSLFERFYARLISDVIIVSHKNSLCLYYSTPGLVRQE